MVPLRIFSSAIFAMAMAMASAAAVASSHKIVMYFTG